MDAILPGQEGRIKVKVSTGGYGGRKIREDVRIRTNAPDGADLAVTVTGVVEKFAEIRPERVRFMGPGDQPLSVRVEIIPRKEYPFKIQSVEAKKGNFIKYELIETCGPERKRCIIRIENTKSDKGRYLDAIYVKTNSRLRPVIPIYITGLIR